MQASPQWGVAAGRWHGRRGPAVQVLVRDGGGRGADAPIRALVRIRDVDGANVWPSLIETVARQFDVGRSEGAEADVAEVLDGANVESRRVAVRRPGGAPLLRPVCGWWSEGPRVVRGTSRYGVGPGLVPAGGGAVGPVRRLRAFRLRLGVLVASAQAAPPAREEERVRLARIGPFDGLVGGGVRARPCGRGAIGSGVALALPCVVGSRCLAQ